MNALNALTKHATRTAVSVDGLRKTYGKKVVLDGVDLSIGEGEIFALLGPNGAGKTTIVRILAARSERWIAKRHGRIKGTEPSRAAATIAQLVATSVGPSSPAWDRLTEIAKERRSSASRPRSSQ